jgi:membrane glycosyltransferase
VEAALLRRSGWAVYMADDLGGSFERAPPNLVEMVARDRRWAQGNLQHLALLGIRGLHPLSRLHMGMGAMAYLASPFWFLFLVTGMALALYANLVPPNYFPTAGRCSRPGRRSTRSARSRCSGCACSRSTRRRFSEWSRSCSSRPRAGSGGGRCRTSCWRS